MGRFREIYINNKNGKYKITSFINCDKSNYKQKGTIVNLYIDKLMFYFDIVDQNTPLLYRGCDYYDLGNFVNDNLNKDNFSVIMGELKKEIDTFAKDFWSLVPV